MSNKGLAHKAGEWSYASAQRVKLFREGGCILRDLKCLLLPFLLLPHSYPSPAAFLSTSLLFLILSLYSLPSSSDFPVNPGSATLSLAGCPSCDITTLWFPFKG